MTEFRYHLKKCFPLIGIYFFGMFMMLWFFQSQMQAGETMYKECRNCGHWNYQFSNTCSLCGETGRFEDVWLKDDCDKRDAKKNKKKSKSLKPKDFHSDLDRFIQKGEYDIFIAPLNRLLSLIKEYQQYEREIYSELPDNYFKELDVAFDNITKARENLIRFHCLEDVHLKKF